jgi:hypothetical protein
MRGGCLWKLWITFAQALFDPKYPPKKPLREAKSALALAPEGVTPPNVKMGMTKCAPF